MFYNFNLSHSTKFRVGISLPISHKRPNDRTAFMV
nr:MAG TPA: hypothetical protein [Caudoviricetes sp.]